MTRWNLHKRFVRNHAIAPALQSILFFGSLGSAFLTPLAANESSTNTIHQTLTVEIGPNGNTQTRTISVGQGETFQDCAPKIPCPQMVILPASRPSGFKIGSPATEAGHVESEVQQERTMSAFAIGKYEVRVAEYLACVKAKACKHPEWSEPDSQHNVFTGKGVTYRSIKASITGSNQPIVGISWQDATDYTVWLSKITGKAYRLPSEAEWEYATRAGTTTAYWWGNDILRNGRAMACCKGCGSTLDANGLFEVTSFAPNPWGLHNVHGNVWEWVADYYCQSYLASPTMDVPRQIKLVQNKGARKGYVSFGADRVSSNRARCAPPCDCAIGLPFAT